MNKEEIEKYISELKAKSSTICELTPDGTRHITIRFNEHKIFLETYFEATEKTVLNVFKEKECVHATIGNTKEMFENARGWAF